MRRAFAAVAFAMAIVFAGANLVSPLWPVYRTELHLTAFALTVVFAAYAFGALARSSPSAVSPTSLAGVRFCSQA